MMIVSFMGAKAAIQYLTTGVKTSHSLGVTDERRKVFHHKAALIKPPSARKAAPVTAEASGEPTNATTEGSSCGFRNRFMRDVGRMVLKNSCSNCAGVIFFSEASLSMKSVTPSEAVGPAKTLFTVMPVPAQLS